MELGIFLTLLFLYFAIGVKFILTNRNIYLFFLVTSILPLTSSLTNLHTRYQISVYYSFAFVLVFYYFIESLTKSKLSKTVVYSFITIVLFITLYIYFYLVLNINNANIDDFLKDIKPLLFLFIGFVFLDFFRFRQLDWRGVSAKKILKYNFIAALCWYFILNNTSIVSIISDDPYYLMNGSRYSSIGTVFVVFYYIAGLSSNRKFDIYDIFYISIPILLSGNRTMMFLMGLLFIVNMLLNSNNILLLFKRIVIFILGITIGLLVMFNLNGELKARMISMLNLDIIKDQLINHRYAPFFHELDSFKWYNYLIGKGMGETIFIPWFAYRDNIDDFNIYMDNIYMSLFIKYGLLMICPLIIFVAFINNISTNKRYKTLVLIYFLIIGLTTSFLYQSGFLLTLLILASFGFLNRRV